MKRDLTVANEEWRTREDSYYDSALVSTPEAIGLELIAEIEWDHESYQFNLTRVWRDVKDGTLWTASDSGCSCPTPFERTHQVDRVFSVHDFDAQYDEARKRSTGEYSYSNFSEDEWRSFVADVQAALDRLKG